MSRIGKKPITIPENVNIDIKDRNISIKGPKGSLDFEIHPKVSIIKDSNTVTITRKTENKFNKSIHGTTRNIIANMIHGVSEGYEKKLEMVGVGYKANVQGNKLVLNVGFSHPVEITAPDGIIFQVQKNNITVSGIDKQLVGQVSANIRVIRKPEPYKGKGIKYKDEIVKRKPGKAAKAVGASGA